MIANNMKDYTFYTFGDKDKYGQEILSTEPQGTIKMAIYTVSNTIGENIKYKDATYLGLTYNKSINDSYVIQYGEEKLKVLYSIPSHRYTQVFLTDM